MLQECFNHLRTPYQCALNIVPPLGGTYFATLYAYSSGFCTLKMGKLLQMCSHTQPHFYLANAVLILKPPAASPKQHLVHFVPAETNTQKLLVPKTNQKAWCAHKSKPWTKSRGLCTGVGRLAGWLWGLTPEKIVDRKQSFLNTNTKIRTLSNVSLSLSIYALPNYSGLFIGIIWKRNELRQNIRRDPNRHYNWAQALICWYFFCPSTPFREDFSSLETSLTCRALPDEKCNGPWYKDLTGGRVSLTENVIQLFLICRNF